MSDEPPIPSGAIKALVDVMNGGPEALRFVANVYEELAEVQEESERRLELIRWLSDCLRPETPMGLVGAVKKEMR